MLLVERHALNALQIDDGGDEIRCRELPLRLPRRLRLVIEADYLAAREQRPVVLRLLRRAVLAMDVDEGGIYLFPDAEIINSGYTSVNQ